MKFEIQNLRWEKKISSGYAFPLCLAFLLCACGVQEPVTKPSHSASLYARDANNAAVKALEEGDIKTALEKVNEAILDDPDFAMPYYNRALLQVLGEEYEGAQESLHKCVELAPEHGEAQLFLGLLLEREDKITEAKSCYAAAKAALGNVTPAMPSTELYLAIATYLSDGLAPGLEAVDVLMAKYPGNPLLRRVRERIRIGERDFFLGWLIDQQAKLKKKQTMGDTPDKPNDTATPGAEAPLKDKERPDAS